MFFAHHYHVSPKCVALSLKVPHVTRTATSACRRHLSKLVLVKRPEGVLPFHGISSDSKGTAPCAFFKRPCHRHLSSQHITTTEHFHHLCKIKAAVPHQCHSTCAAAFHTVSHHSSGTMKISAASRPRLQRNLSQYVTKMRHLQRLKEDEEFCRKSLDSAKFAVYYALRPLVEQRKGDRRFHIAWKDKTGWPIFQYRFVIIVRKFGIFFYMSTVYILYLF